MKKQSFVVIQDWMYNLDLRLPEIVAYAVIFGFSMDGESDYHGGRAYLCRKLAATKPTVDKALQTLEAKGLIVKSSRILNGVEYSTFTAVVPEYAIAAPVAAPAPAPAPKPEKKAAAPVWQAAIAEAAPELICDGVAAALDALAGEPKWKGKSLNAWKLRIKDLKELSGGDLSLAVAIIEQTIKRDWAAFYSLKSPQNDYPASAGPSYQRAGESPKMGRMTGTEMSEALAMAAASRFEQSMEG